MAIAYEEKNRLRRSSKIAESSVIELKQEVSSLQSHVDEIDVERKSSLNNLLLRLLQEKFLQKRFCTEIRVFKTQGGP